MKLCPILWFFVTFWISTSSTASFNGKNNSTNFLTLKSCLLHRGVNPENMIEKHGYLKLNWQWNTRGITIYPLAYLVPDNAKEIQHAVNCGRNLNIRVVPRNGGHGFAKYAFGDLNSLVVDLQKLNEVSIEKGGMRGVIGAGGTLGPIGYQLWSAGSCLIPTGLCPTVGISGSALGGGYGLFARLYGMTTDSILEMEFVNANGELLVANSSLNSDLFWALRGAGGGSFGIVTKFTFKLYPAPTQVIFADIYFDFVQFPSVFKSWQQLFFKTNVTRRLGSYFIIKEHSIWLTFAHIQHGKPLGTDLMDQIIAGFPSPKNITLNTYTYPEYLINSAQIYGFHGAISPSMNLTTPADLLNLTKVEGGHEYFKSGPSAYVDSILTQPDISKLYGLIGKLVPKGFIFFEPYGGAINEKSTTYNAFVHRGNILFNMAVYYEGEAEDKEQFNWMKNFNVQTKLLLDHKESYQNYIDDEMGDYLQRYYGENLRRLIQIKKKVDPDNFFHNGQSIPLNLSENN